MKWSAWPGFAVSGMRVDVIISGVPPGAPPGSGLRTKTILQNIEVLSAGANYQKDTEGKPVQVPVVNLLVTPEQAEILSLAGNEMKIQLVLRNPLDTQIAKTAGSAMGKLFDEVKPEVPRPAPPPRTLVAAARKPAPPPPPPATPAPIVTTYLIEVMNGAKHAEVKFVRPGEEKH